MATMDLVPVSKMARDQLVDNLFNADGSVNKKSAIYLAKTLPSILLDYCRHLAEQATKSARANSAPSKTQHQLKPFFLFGELLGKSPQITGLMYDYFENSGFQPLPESLFKAYREDEAQKIAYILPGFSDVSLKEILLCLFKYLTYNPKWFSSVWNWSELGRIIALHTVPDILYLAGCCLSAITRPSRIQHINYMRDMFLQFPEGHQQLIDCQIRYRFMYNNTFRPCIETKKEKANELVSAFGESESGYEYCHESLAKITNVLLVKHSLALSDEARRSFEIKRKRVIDTFVTVPTIEDCISQIAYSISINRPCIIRGQSGSGKSAMLDYIAAQTNRLNPPQYIKVQIGDQIDSKLLIGTYVCTEIPGQFEWQPGPLTRAMSYGSWIVFDDIDSAPSEMAQVIHSVIENGNLSCVSCCPVKIDSPHPDFRIFFTQRSRQTSSSADAPRIGFGFIERLCDIVDVPNLTNDDLKRVIESRYNFSSFLARTVLQLFESSKDLIEKTNINRATRKLNFRDLFKLCDRIKHLAIEINMNPRAEKFSSGDLDFILFESIDCLLASLPSIHLRQAVEKLGSVLNKAANVVQDSVFQRTPEIKVESKTFSVGRVKLKCYQNSPSSSSRTKSTMGYAKPSLRLMESVSLCIKYNEPVLLVGETGVGKTSIVQHIANLMNTDLVVINLSQQSDSSDLLGGYKPVEIRELMRSMHDRFCQLFKRTYNEDQNSKFLTNVESMFVSSKTGIQWREYIGLVVVICSNALNKSLSAEMNRTWNELHLKALRLQSRIMADKDVAPMALSFSEGTLLRAVKEGQWILLDEINLAEPEVLQCLVLILDSIKRHSVFMFNAGDDEAPVTIHPNFRIFACMNPATDVGKRELVPGTRGRFTELFVDDIWEKQDLRIIVESYVKSCLTPAQIESIVNFYLEVRSRTNVLSDISGNSPVYSLRTLCRALQICSINVCQNMEKSLFESLRITFLQQLNDQSIFQVMKVMEKTVFSKETVTKLISMEAPKPKDKNQYVQVEGFWIQKSDLEPVEDEKYITTESIKENLRSLSRIISLSQRKLPILIQGNTSVGKTSLIMYLAQLTGNKCYRINNHEHTDLQEYVGRYVLKEDGSLQFEKGLLVKAMERGYWIILDELNLAPSELLEALNRALDDNRELFIPETRQTIKASSRFMLFATQNPPEEYAGRKLLSRAFRNRFIELHFDQIPGKELEMILEKRCEMAPQYAKKIINVMNELQLIRRESGCFNGKNGFMTLRDLFRWGERYATFKKTAPQFMDWDLHIAKEGLILLEGRVRTISEAETVKNVIEKVFNKKLDRDEIYSLAGFNTANIPEFFKHIYFSREFKKLFVQLSRALKYKEPVLLCGQTGCGKTTACQLYAAMEMLELITYNCHLNTESSDFVGSVRPCRSEAGDSKTSHQTFPWYNGPLVEAMQGSVFLLDEISLADDAVLERLNSVLEPSRSLTLTERDGREIFANATFRFVATMNPGGDFGKKELSPALRNRFTEIYCHNTTDIDQIIPIIQQSLYPALKKVKIITGLLAVMKDFLQAYYQGSSTISIRDILSWTQFINKTTMVNQKRPLSVQEATINGASLVFFDQFGTGGHQNSRLKSNKQLKLQLRSQLKASVREKFGLDSVYVERVPSVLELDKDIVCFKKFSLLKGPLPIYESSSIEFIIDAPTVRNNLMKIVRAMQLDRPILLEGDPGAGKTSVVTALAKLTGHELIRINLSEQTDISDLFGSDLPDASISSSDDAPRFCWHDGPLLRAIKKSSWVLLDEMNLASQSVLEGLNACFDHRGEIFIPELNKRIKVDRSSTRIFACQNPHSQGAARKGLPQSFVNRFTSIYIEPHTDEDLYTVIKKMYGTLSDDNIHKMIQFNRGVAEKFRNADMEFNLRDLLYWCELITRHAKSNKFSESNLHEPERFVQFVYLDRLRSNAQRADIIFLFESIFEKVVYEPPFRDMRIGEKSIIVERSVLSRNKRQGALLPQTCILKYQLPYLESIAKALEYNKMPIIIGDVGVGKRTMVRILASLTGNELNIVGANQDMDTIELLGSYEQKSLQREIIDLIEESRDFVTDLMNSISHRYNAATWSTLLKHIWSTLYHTAIREVHLSKSDLAAAFRFQLVELRELMEKIGPLALTHVEARYKNLIERIDRIRMKFLYDSDSMYSVGNFEWIDSILIKAIRHGQWVLIENANLLNPATLDRLNSLVEPNGTISLNEKGAGPNGIETLTPHPNFRLLLTMCPDHGELSRAMRNRGAEIFVQTRFFFEDFLMLLYQNGFVPEEDRPCMSYSIMETCVEAHKKITDEEAHESESGNILAYFALNCIPRLTHQIRRGLDTDQVLADLLVAHYNHRGYHEGCNEEIMHPYIREKMTENRKKYLVNLNDQRYQWVHLIYDLVSLTTGDAITAMVDRDNQIFFDETRLDDYLKPDEMIENIDIVNTCTTVKIFLELSTHTDFTYRQGFISETFESFNNVMTSVEGHIDLLSSEYIPHIRSQLPQSCFLPMDELYIDTRNSPDIHYYLMSNDLESTTTKEMMQNRWILTLHRIMLRMIIELVEERSLENTRLDSLWSLSEKVRTGKMVKEDLIRPQAEIVSDLFDLLDGLLRTVSSRLYDSNMIGKMMARFFWMHYFICKLKKGNPPHELAALCNQLPMLWALTHQKVIEPLINDCGLKNIVFRNKKFTNRVQDICHFLDMTLSKPCRDEKLYFNKVINNLATTPKICDSFYREVDKLFTSLLGKYVSRSHSSTQFVKEDCRGLTALHDTLVASCLVWSNSHYLQLLYQIQDNMSELEQAEKNLNYIACQQLIDDNLKTLESKREEYNVHLQRIQVQPAYRANCLSVNRKRHGQDQFAPIWQVEFIQQRYSLLDPKRTEPVKLKATIKKTLANIPGIIMSPRYYSTLIKFIHGVKERIENYDADSQPSISRINENLYTLFLLDHLIENVILDNQVVGWTKLRVTTCDLATQAPLIPEYSPIVSLVASYCLDLPHLKLNSYESQKSQLLSVLSYLWRNYTAVKLYKNEDTHDLNLIRRLIHLRQESEPEITEEGVVSSNRCQHTELECDCIDQYIMTRVSEFKNFMDTVRSNMDEDDCRVVLKAMRLIYYGQLNYLGYAPVFTLDPALRSREKMEVYKSELAHIKMELQFRNTLYYWRTGENLSLNGEPEDLHLYPFSMQLLVERRIKLEHTVAKLRREHQNRPKSDDGTLYYELRKDVEFTLQRFTTNIQNLMTALISCLKDKSKTRHQKLVNINTKCRMLIKSFEKSILRFRSEYSLYTDLLTNFLVGLCITQQGLRCLYSRLEQKMQIVELRLAYPSPEKFANDIMCVFSFNSLNRGNLESVCKKLKFFSKLEYLCPKEEINNMQSLLLKTVLIQLNHHITITPSDIQRCIPIVRNIADLFQAAWLKRKQYLEEQRKKREDLFQYKVSKSTLGNEVSYEDQEFLDICARFPTYEHVFKDILGLDSVLPSSDKENLSTEEKLTNLHRSVNVSMCVDICKAHYKFMMEASRNLLGQSDRSSQNDQLQKMDLSQMVHLEAKILNTITRHCILSLDKRFDANSFECHLLQAYNLLKVLKKTQQPEKTDEILGTIESLDEEYFDVHHSADAHEALKLQEYIRRLESSIASIRAEAIYEENSIILDILKLSARIGSFLITDPLMKFMTGAHAMLEKIDKWNQTNGLQKKFKLIDESYTLVELITSWRKIEIDSLKFTLHRVKRRYIDNSLCDLWFSLYEAFSDPINCVLNLCKAMEFVEEDFEFTEEYEEFFYQGFAKFIQQFFEAATLGDFQIRLDLVFSFAIQTRFASLYEKNRLYEPVQSANKTTPEPFKVNYEKLTTFVYNVYRQHEGLFEPLKEEMKREDELKSKELMTEIRITAWQNRSLWDIKSNFRLSHRKLNKVMNRYLEVLRRPIVVNHKADKPELTSQSMDFANADGLSAKLAKIRQNIEATKRPINEQQQVPVSSLSNTNKLVEKLKSLARENNEAIEARYVKNLEAIEQTMSSNLDAIKNFYSHRLEEIIIESKDSKEVKEEKHKLCRQMYHSKKFALQSIFKSLQDLGVSYQRGLNSSQSIDMQILSLEPLHGMIQNQSELVLKAASTLVSDETITACNLMYKKMIATYTMVTTKIGQELTSDQKQRTDGLATDIVRDISVQTRNAALIYDNYIGIQAASTRLATLLAGHMDNSPIPIYNFPKIHRTVKKFNDLVGRTLLAMTKLEEICRLAESVNIVDNHQSDLDQSDDMEVAQPPVESHRSWLDESIHSIDAKNSLLTSKQRHHIKCHLKDSQKSILSVSDTLRDMLNNTNKSHLYSEDDLDLLNHLYGNYISAFSRFIPIEEGKLVPPNCQPGTLIGSLIELRDEARDKMEAHLKIEDEICVEIEEYSNKRKLDIRLHKLIRQIKLATQEIYKNELEFKTNAETLKSESMKRKMKPYNQIDSVEIRNALRASQVFKHVGDIFVTLNNEYKSADIQPVVSRLAPILVIYTQEVAGYLNVILQTLHTKLGSAIKLFTFFMDLRENGFGLPIKSLEDGPGEGAVPSSKPSEDNTGFGDGQGETDVSKKLEFESQLDDLKKNDGDEKEKGDDDKLDTEDIKAHDDGVEMSEDIDAKAEGADKNETEPADDKDKNEDEEEDQERLDELDKEMDRVDEDEGHLDENLWGEKDEKMPGEEEDDEQDLRDTSADLSSDATPDERELQAKDDQLTQAKGSTSNEQQEAAAKDGESEQEDKENELDQDKTKPEDAQGEGGDEEETEVGKEKKKEEKQITGEEEEAQDENDELDLQDEAALALKREEDNQEVKMEEDDANAVEDPSKFVDDTLMSEGEDNGEKEAEVKSEGELSDDEAESQEADQEADKRSSDIDELEIDKQLEEAAKHPLIHLPLNNTVDEAIDEESQKGPQKKGRDAGQQMQGQVFGQHACYDILPEEADDPIDFDDDDQTNQAEEELNQVPVQQTASASNGSNKKPQDLAGEQAAGTSSAAPAEAEEMGDKSSDDKDMDETATEVGQTLEEQEEESDGKSLQKKRTLAERDEKSKQDESIKRQKILDADEDGGKQTKSEKQVADQPRSAQNVRHIAQGNESTSNVEVIDILSDSDDEPMREEPENADKSGSTRLDPRPSKQMQTQTQQTQQSEDGSQRDEESESSAANTTAPLQIDTTQEEEEEAGISKAQLDEEEGELSSISSFNDDLKLTSSDLPVDEEFSFKSASFEQEGPSSYNTNYGLLKHIALLQDDSTREDKELAGSVLAKIDEILSSEDQRVAATDKSKLASNNEHESLTADLLQSYWIECTKSTGHLVHELCQQLQIVLQPTKMSKYRGDYKTGKRLNMRKIISYIASHYRKDKIWLRRTKPNKRTYNICLAVDNSSSMSENNCRQMTYQSLALLAKSLSIIESGALSVVSFGQQVRCIHDFGQPYVEAVGAQWLQDLRFNEPKTSYSQLLKFSCDLFERQAQATLGQQSTQIQTVNQLLVIISDGRNVSHEEEEVKLQLRRLRFQGVLTLFIIIDDLNLNKGNSIVDCKRTVGLGKQVKLLNYMELFPFPFYVLLRQLDAMPSVLGDALRQWFELVSSAELTF